MKPVKDLFEFKTLSIRHITRVLDLITSHLLRVKFCGAHYRRSKINETTKNVESAKLRTLRSLVLRALLALVRHVPCALRTLLPHVHHILHALLLTTMICNLY